MNETNVSVTCIICSSVEAAIEQSCQGICCPNGHYMCRCDLNQYMSHNVLSQMYKLKYNKCDVSCPELGCGACYDAVSLFEKLDSNERNRYLQIANALAADGLSAIPRIKNDLLDALSLTCPHCSNAVDPTPDACSAVSCLFCGYYYCNCCFLGFGKDQLDRGNKAAHEHCAEHDGDKPIDQRSAFLPIEIIAAGHKFTKRGRIIKVLQMQIANCVGDLVDKREVALAALLCRTELDEAGVTISDVMLAATAPCAEAGVAPDLRETMWCEGVTEDTEEKDDSVSRQLTQLANAMHQENMTASAQLLSCIESSQLDPHFVCGHCGENLLILALCHSDRLVATTLLIGERGADPRCLMVNGPVAGQRSALYIAAEKGFVAEVRAMMEIPGISWNTQASFDDKFGLTPLHVAIQYGQLEVVLYLIDELHADVNAPAALNPITPVMTAVQFGRDEVLAALIQRGGRVDTRSREGRYPMYVAIEKGHISTIKYLVSDCGINVNAPTTIEATVAPALWIPIHCDNSYLIPLLITIGADVNAQDKEFGFSPLHYAVLKGVDDAVELLLLSGANPYALSATGRTAMYMAAELGHAGIVRMLVEKCNDGVEKILNAPCSLTKEYPLHIATMFNKPEVVAVLLNLGADLTVVTTDGFTAMDLAARRRPELDTIFLHFCCYVERKSILDNAIRKKMKNRECLTGTEETNEKIESLNVIKDNELGIGAKDKMAAMSLQNMSIPFAGMATCAAIFISFYFLSQSDT